jgi:hypothetical protein
VAILRNIRASFHQVFGFFKGVLCQDGFEKLQIDWNGISANNDAAVVFS